MKPPEDVTSKAAGSQVSTLGRLELFPLLYVSSTLGSRRIGGGYDVKIVGCFGLKEQAAQNTNAGGGRTYSVSSCWSSC
jgi:hypothetical protein